MTENYRERSSGSFLFRKKGPTEHGLHAEHLKEISGDDITLDSLRLAGPGEIHIGIEKRTQLIEDLIARTPVEKVTDRDFVAVPQLRSEVLIRFPHHH